MTLAELLTSQRRWGRTRARKLLQALALSENKRLGTLTPRQRALLSTGGCSEKPRSRDTGPASERLAVEVLRVQRQPCRPPALNERPPEARWKARRRSVEGGDEGDRAGGEADGEDQAGQVEEGAGDEDEDGAGEQGRVGAVAGEVLAGGDLEAAEARRARRRRRSRSGSCSKTPIAEHHDAGEDGQLGERERAPRRRRSLVALGLVASRSTAASRPDNGHPEETLTRHQPISIPSGPRRGRECQWPQPGSPTSAREIRSHLCSAGAASIRSSSSRLRVSSSARSLRAGAAPRRSASPASRAPPPARRGRAPAARRDGRDAGVDLEAREGLGEEASRAALRGGRSGAAARPARAARRRRREARVRVSRSSRSGITRHRV